MGMTTFFLDDGQRVQLTSDGLASGYDIVSISVIGKELPLARNGEFETEEEAIEAAKARIASYFQAKRLVRRSQQS